MQNERALPRLFFDDTGPCDGYWQYSDKHHTLPTDAASTIARDWRRASPKTTRWYSSSRKELAICEVMGASRRWRVGQINPPLHG
jgi:hypothetical protein